MVSILTTQNGVTALYIASQEGHVTIVRLLLVKGADVNICDKVVMNLYHLYVCARIRGDRHTHTQTDTHTQSKYRNPCCACAPRVNNKGCKKAHVLGKERPIV